jgi:hypothetical protein
MIIFQRLYICSGCVLREGTLGGGEGVNTVEEGKGVNNIANFFCNFYEIILIIVFKTSTEYAQMPCALPSCQSLLFSLLQ